MAGFLSASALVSPKAVVSKIPKCGACGLFRHCDSPKMPPSGKGRKRILILGESPGETEDERGVQFIGKSGQHLEQHLRKVGIEMRRDCWISNVVICHPSGNNTTDDHVEYCRPTVFNTIADKDPDVIICFGGFAVKSLIGHVWREDVGPMKRWAGFRIPSQKPNSWICHPSHTLITTKRGLIPIRKVRLGDDVWTHEGRWKRVYELFERRYDGDLITIRRACSQVPVEATAEHPFLVERNGVRDWVAANDIGVGDYLVEALPSEPQEPIDGQVVWRFKRQRTYSGGRVAKGAQEVRAEYHTMRLLGYYLAEGYLHDKYTTAFAFHHKEKEYKQEVKESFCAVFNTQNKIRTRRRKMLYKGRRCNISEVLCYGSIGAQFFSTIPKGARKKRMPSWVWDCSNDLLIPLLRAIWNGDGWEQGCNQFGIGFSSKHLIEDVRRLLLRFGIVSNLRYRKDGVTTFLINGKDRECIRNEWWSLYVRGGWADKLAKLIDHPLEKLSKQRHWKTRVVIKGSDVLYQVEKITMQRVKCDVYNMEVEDDHSYLANGVASHNCPTYHPSYLLRQNDPVLELHFHRHLKAAVALQGKPWQKLPDYAKQIQVIISPTEAATALRKFIDARPKYAAVDIESDRLKPDHKDSRIVCCSVSDGKTTLAYPWHGDVITLTKELLLNKKIGKVMSNCKFELRWFYRELGFEIRNVVWDTMLAAHVLDNRGGKDDTLNQFTAGITSLKFQTFVRLGQPSYDDHIKQFLKAKGSNEPNRIGDIDLRQLLLYCGLDSLYEVIVAKQQMEELGYDKR